MQTFHLAPMSRGILVLTVLLLFLPFLLVSLIYAWVWLRFRPTAFVINPNTLEVIWPLKQRQIPRAGIRDVRLISRAELKREIGWTARVGAGGLWGGFGWLWTQRWGIVQMYVSRTTDLVWIARGSERPWLITPERPEEFIRQLLPAKEPRV
jgi:hypothetical protein